MIAGGEVGIGGPAALPSSPLARRAVLLVAALGVLEMALLLWWQGNAYWNFSDGVYALSSREFLHGVVPYHDFAAAQPPPVFLFGTLLLAVSDGVGALHVGLGLINLVSAGLVGVGVWRLDGRVWPACLAALVAPLLPISLIGHAQLLPETLAAPLLLAGAMLCARARGQVGGGLLLAVAVWCKLAFLVPAIAIAFSAPASRRVVLTVLGCSVGLFEASVAVFGAGVWRETVVAQFQVGHASLRYVAGLLAQAAWNELPLAIGLAAFIALFVVKRVDFNAGQAPLARTLMAAAAGGLLLGLTVFKRGSYIDVLIVAEPPLLILAACAAASIWPTSRRARAVVSLIVVFLAAQSVSLLLHPSDPWVAVRPLAASGLAWTAGPSEVDRAVSVASGCPRRLAYAGDPYIAFLASRRTPGLQPDTFMLGRAAEDLTFARRAARDRPVCP